MEKQCRKVVIGEDATTSLVSSSVSFSPLTAGEPIRTCRSIRAFLPREVAYAKLERIPETTALAKWRQYAALAGGGGDWGRVARHQGQTGGTGARGG